MHFRYYTHLNSHDTVYWNRFGLFSSVTQSCLTLCDPWTVAHLASLSITNSQSLLKLMSIDLVMQYNRLILCCPLLLLSSFFANIRVFSIDFASGGQSTECMAHRTLLNGSTKANYFNCTVNSLLTNKFPSESMSVSPICS